MFAGTFGFLKALARHGRDPAYLYDDLTSGLMPPEHIFNILSCALIKVDDSESFDPAEKTEWFMNTAGLQESAYVARLVLNHAMIGSVKKKQVQTANEIQGVHVKSSRFLQQNLKKLGVSLAVILSILTALVCTSFLL